MMMKHALLTRLRGCRSGAAAAEMVLIAPALAGLLFVGKDVGLAFWEKHQLEQAAQRGIELAVAPGTIGTGSFSHLDPEVRAAYGKPVQSLTFQSTAYVTSLKSTFLAHLRSLKQFCHKWLLAVVDASSSCPPLRESCLDHHLAHTQ